MVSRRWIMAQLAAASMGLFGGTAAAGAWLIFVKDALTFPVYVLAVGGFAVVFGSFRAALGSTFRKEDDVDH